MVCLFYFTYLKSIMSIFKGAFSRSFVEFTQTSPVAKELLDWSRDTYSPDEHYWATLNFNTHLHTPGGYKGMNEKKIIS
jgi:hypothetical protein